MRTHLGGLRKQGSGTKIKRLFCSLMQSSFTTVCAICKRAALFRSGKSFVTGFESRAILTTVIMRTTLSV